MSGLIARARSFWRGLRRPDRLEAEMDEEMRFHLEMEAERLVRERGLEPAEARRQAAVAFGGREKYKEEGRDARGLTWVSGLSLDLKLGARMLAKNPGITVIGGMGMAVGIAISAAVFSVIGAMVNPVVPLEEGERVVVLANFHAATGGDHRETHLHDLPAWREELSALADIGAHRAVNRNLVTGEGPAEPLRVVEMTASGFRIARVPPLLGRYLVDEDEREGAPAVTVIGYDLWRDRFGSRRDVVGRTLQLGAEPHTIVGVMPAGFAFPVNNRLWVPLRLDPLDFERGAAPEIDVFARLAPGATLDGARAQLSTLGRRMAGTHPETHEHIRPTVAPYALSFMDSPQLIWALRVGRFLVGILLLVIAVNVAILVYARTASRAGEIAVRMALGASRRRVVTQLFAEALLLSALAAVIGLVGAHLLLARVRLFMQPMLEQVPFWWDFRLSPAAVAYVATLALLAAGVVGVVPALKATGKRVQATLRQLGGATGMRMGRTWTVLIALQVAVAVALLPLGAALPLRDIIGSRSPQPAVPLEEIFTASISMDYGTPPTARAEAYRREWAARFAERQAELVRRLEREPGVSAVSFASATPGGEASRFVEAEGINPAPDPRGYPVMSLEVDPGIFDLFGARLLSGRTFNSADLTGTASAVVVNASFAEALVPGGSALGRRFRYSGAGEGAGPGGVEAGGWYEIVGVVGDLVPTRGDGSLDATEVYHPTTGAYTVLARVRDEPLGTVAARLREMTTAIDPSLRLGEVTTVAQRLERQRAPERLTMLVLVALTSSVLLLSAAGVHALVALTVSQRRREIGLRTALGARPRQVLASIASHAVRQLALGLAIGLVGAGALIPAITNTPARAALLLTTVATLMLTVGLLAVIGPARRGLRIQPMEALRDE